MPLLRSTRTYLAMYNPSDATELAHLAAMRDLAEGGDDPFTRHRFDPGHFTASAFILAPEGDALLLVHHPKLARWLQPGGHVEPHDADLSQAARREAGEETGLVDLPTMGTGIFDVDVHIIPARKAEPEHQHFDVRFLFRSPTRTLRLEDGITGALWVPLSEVTATNSDESVARATRKLRVR